MTTKALWLGVLLAGCLAGRGQIILTQGQGFHYQFSGVPLTGKQTPTNMPTGGFTITFGSPPAEDCSYRIAMFEDKSGQPPLWTHEGGHLEFPTVKGAWQDLQGEISVDVGAGSLRIDCFRVRIVALAEGSMNIHETVFVPVDHAAAAEARWKELLAAEDELYEMEPSSFEGAAFEEFLNQAAHKAGELADQFRDYLTSSPQSSVYIPSTGEHRTTSPHREAAWDKWMDWLNNAAFVLPERKAELEKVEQECLSDPQLSRRRRTAIRNDQVTRTRDLAERERLVRQVMEEAQNPVNFFCDHMLDIAEYSDYPRAREIIDEILNLEYERRPLEWYHERFSPTVDVEACIRSQKQQLQDAQGRARALQERLALIGRPVELKFTALDGREVDLNQFRGKIVLLEFWATTCAPCVAAIPKIKSVWDDLHPSGFEVIGLSYDTDRKKLERFVKRNAVPWPQFFSPEGMDAALLKSFNQPGPPTYWLVDHEGILVDMNAHDNLERRVKRLLARKAVSTAKPASDK